jgi:integrase
MEKMTEKQLIKYLDREVILFQQDVDKGLYIDAGKMTVEEMCQRWMNDYAIKHLQPKTLNGYKDYLRRIIQSLGHIKLDKLQPHHLNEFYNILMGSNMRRDNRYVLNEKYIDDIRYQANDLIVKAAISIKTLDNLLKGNPTVYSIAAKLSDCLNVPLKKLFNATEGKVLSPKTILHHHRLLSSILNKAVKWGIIVTNPTARVDVPKVKHKEAIYYDDEQALQMFALLSEEPLKYQAAIYVALYGGLRIGEVTALLWSDIDFNEKTISISKTRQFVSGLGSFDKEPKTESSVRKISISSGVIDILREHKDEQEKDRLRFGSQWVETGKVFTQKNGQSMFPNSPSQWFNKWLKRTGLPKITYHQLRHSHASILIANGVDIATVSRRLGHVRISTTIDTYTHPIKRKDSEAADLLDNVLMLSRIERPVTKIDAVEPK